MRVLVNVDPSPEQLKILSDAQPGFRLIRGAAGSGKTTSALLRLRQLCASRVRRRERLNSQEPVRVLVLTFNRTLRGYIEQLAKEQVGENSPLELTIQTFAKWASSLVHNGISIEDGPSRIRALLQSVEFAVPNLDYFADEIQYILGRFPPDKRKEYLQAERSGRGRAPAVPQERRAVLLDEVIKPYEAEKSQNGEIDWHDIALLAANATSDRYDIVVADECQDLSANQVRAILAHLQEDHSTTFIIDAVQRIYPQSFRWREIGMEIRPEMVFQLTRNHRNTREIARFAASLVQGLPAEEDGLLPNAEACENTGPPPEVVVGTFSAQLDYMLEQVLPCLDSEDTVAILHPKGGGWFNYTRKVLEKRGIAYCELTRKADWPSGPELLALSTIHSSKGLEFDHVLLPGLNQEVTPHGTEDGDGRLDSLRRLVAMGVGRARRTARIGYKPGEKSTLIGLIDPGSYRLVRV